MLTLLLPIAIVLVGYILSRDWPSHMYVLVHVYAPVVRITSFLLHTKVFYQLAIDDIHVGLS